MTRPQKDTGPIIAAMLLITLGLMSFMGIGLLWPFFILIPGLAMMIMATRTGEVGAAAFSIPGAIMTGIGGLLFVQNLTNYWESWAYAWTLIPVFVGWGLHVMARGMDDPDLHTAGTWTIRGGLIAFAIFGAFFEFVIGLGGIGTSGALVVILVGVLMLINALRSEPLLPSALAGDAYAKRKNRLGGKAKRKRPEDALFTGPVVYGTRGRRDVSSLMLEDDTPDANELSFE